MQSLSARPALVASGSASRRPARRPLVTRAQADDAAVPSAWRGALLGALAATSLVCELC